ncbi:hypothetical protein B9Z19DRAFT_1034869, partial [Tuber borchii]
MERPNIPSALRTAMVALRASDSKKVYVHKALLNSKVMATGGCTWSCFPSTTVTSFIEYLYQGDYTSSAVITSSGASESACE